MMQLTNWRITFTRINQNDAYVLSFTIALMKHMQSQIVFHYHTEYYTPVIVTRPTLAYGFWEYLGNNQIAIKKFYR